VCNNKFVINLQGFKTDLPLHTRFNNSIKTAHSSDFGLFTVFPSVSQGFETTVVMVNIILSMKPNARNRIKKEVTFDKKIIT